MYYLLGPRQRGFSGSDWLRFAILSSAVIVWIPGLCWAQAGAPATWAIAVGVEKLEGGEAAGRVGAVEATGAIGKWLTETAGVKPDHLLVMSDEGQGEAPVELGPAGGVNLLPTTANLKWAIDKWLGPRVRPDDLVLIYVAARCGLSPRAEGVEKERELVVFSHDADPELRDSQRPGWSIEVAIGNLLREHKLRGRVLIWLDTPLVGAEGESRSITGALARLAMGGRGRASTRATWPRVSVWHCGEVSGEEGGGKPLLARVAIEAQGLARSPRNLAAALRLMQQDRSLKEAGFGTWGALDAGWSLWARDAGIAPERKTTQVIQRGHALAIKRLLFTADSANLLAASEDSTVTIHRVSEALAGLSTKVPPLVQVLAYHTIGISALAISDDDRYLASGDGSGQIVIFDLARQKRLEGTIATLDQPFAELAFLPGSSTLVGLDQGARAWLWELQPEAGSFRSRRLPGAGVARLMSRAKRAGGIGLAIAGDDDTGDIHLYDAKGNLVRSLAGLARGATALALSPDGAALSVGDEAGRFLVVNVRQEGAERLFEQSLPDAVACLSWSDFGELAASAGTEVRIVALSKLKAAPHILSATEPVAALALAPDGRSLAALAGAKVLTWSLSGDAPPARLDLAMNQEGSTLPVSLAFSPDGSVLAVGDFEGRMRLFMPSDRDLLVEVPADRAQIAQLSVDAQARALLQVTADGVAQAWDLQDDASALAPLRGRFSAGVVLPGGKPGIEPRLLLADFGTGDLSLYTFPGNIPLDQQFERPPASRGGGPARDRFSLLATNLDGSLVAAASTSSTLVTVWKSSGTKPIWHHYSPHERSLTAVAFCRDGLLMTASLDGQLALHKVDGPAGAEPRKPITGTDPITAAIAHPKKGSHGAAGTRSGRVFLWTDGAVPRSLGTLQGPVQALAFSSDGTTLTAAAGREQSLVAWKIEPSQTRLEYARVHTEQVRALATLGGPAALVASAGDDATIRIWSVKDRSHRLTLTCLPSTSAKDWIAFAPKGPFDGSEEGRKRVTLSMAGLLDAIPVDRFYKGLMEPGLLSDVLAGKEPPPPPVPLDQMDTRRPPTMRVAEQSLMKDGGVKIVVDVTDQGAGISEVFCFEGLPGIRQKRLREILKEGSGRYTFTGELSPGDNSFWLSAKSEDGLWESEPSPCETIAYNEPSSDRRLHVLTVGVGKYNDPSLSTLSFAQRDALEFSEIFKRRQRNSLYREVLVSDPLIDEKASREAILNGLGSAARRTESQDTLFVLLSGHGKADGEGKYYFIPQSARGKNPSGLSLEELPEQGVPADEILANLMEARAKRCLLVLDSCESGAISSSQLAPPRFVGALNPDAAVEESANPTGRKAEVRGAIETTQRQFGGVIVAAAPEGASAWENPLLEHSVLSYCLLAGVKAVDPIPVFDRLSLSRDDWLSLPSVESVSGGGANVGLLLEYSRRAVPVLSEKIQIDQFEPLVFGDPRDYVLIPIQDDGKEERTQP